MSLAYIFPGQGSQYPGMGKNLVENFPVAKLLFEEANDALRFSISKLCFDGSVEDVMAALIEVREAELSAEELDRIEQMAREARERA